MGTEQILRSTKNDGSTNVNYQAALLYFNGKTAAEERVAIGVLGLAPDTHEVVLELLFNPTVMVLIYPDLDPIGLEQLLEGINERFDLAEAWVERTTDMPVDIRDVMPLICDYGGQSFVWGQVRYGVCDDLEGRVTEMYDDFIGYREEVIERAQMEAGTAAFTAFISERDRAVLSALEAYDRRQFDPDDRGES